MSAYICSGGLMKGAQVCGTVFCNSVRDFLIRSVFFWKEAVDCVPNL